MNSLGRKDRRFKYSVVEMPMVVTVMVLIMMLVVLIVMAMVVIAAICKMCVAKGYMVC